MSGLKMKYFVLKPRSKFFNDPYAGASRHAMREYADMIREENEELANELRQWVEAELLYELTKLDKESQKNRR